MSAYKSDFLRVLSERGFIHQVSEPEALDARAAAGPITAYIGYDCTAPSLHIGHLLPTMMLYWMQQTGHRPIALMGGGTTRVGDPSGKDESRKILTDDDHQRESEEHPQDLRQIPEIRQRPERRRHGQQCRLAELAQLHRHAARRRPAFLGQPHAVVRFA